LRKKKRAIGITSRKTKIVCTIGPATSSEDMVRSLILRGVDCFRLNFSHGTLEEHADRIRTIRKAAGELSKIVAVMQDLPGPKIRVGLLRNGVMQLRRGDNVELVEESNYTAKDYEIPINMEKLSESIVKSSTISLADGTIKLRVVGEEKGKVKCICTQGGQLVSGKGVNIAGLKYSGLTQRDRELIKFGLEQNVDFIAVSFVKSSKDMVEARSEIAMSSEKPLLIAKIEKKEAVKDLVNIIRESDCIMVARGDLGVENPLELVPIIQKRIINLAMQNSKPTITATQILESMVLNPSPTRAEVTDIANAIIDGTDALMLSEETAVGRYPLACVEVLDKVARVTEVKMMKNWRHAEISSRNDVKSSLAEAAVKISKEINSEIIISLSDSLEFVAGVSRHRPQAFIIVPTDSDSKMRKLNIVWGVKPVEFNRSSMKVDDVAATIASKLGLNGKKLCVAVGREAMGEGGLFVFRPKN
jgi:pyruvate kinase